jgi:nitroreductase
VAEAPVIIIAIGLRDDWDQKAEEVLREGVQRGAGKVEEIETQKQEALEFLSSIRKDVWLNRHIMVAVTTMMLLAEAYGFDTAAMEGFDPVKVKQEFGIPEEAEVVALLAIGRNKGPDKPYPGRVPVDQTVYHERYGVPWQEPQIA